MGPAGGVAASMLLTKLPAVLDSADGKEGSSLSLPTKSRQCQSRNLPIPRASCQYTSSTLLSARASSGARAEYYRITSN